MRMLHNREMFKNYLHNLVLKLRIKNIYRCINVHLFPNNVSSDFISEGGKSFAFPYSFGIEFHS